MKIPTIQFPRVGHRAGQCVVRCLTGSGNCLMYLHSMAANGNPVFAGYRAAWPLTEEHARFYARKCAELLPRLMDGTPARYDVARVARTPQ